MTVFVDLIRLFCPGFLATVAVFGITILPSVEVMNFEGCSRFCTESQKLLEDVFFLFFSVFDCHCALVH